MIRTPDLINGAFEFLGSVASWQNVYRLVKDKKVSGVSINAMIFFMAWGTWNLYYYPGLGQPISTIGAATMLLANTTWFVLAIMSQYKEEV